MLGTIDFWKIVISLGMPGLALGVLYMLFKRFDWKISQVPKSWAGPLALIFMLVVAGLIYFALDRYSPERGDVREGAILFDLIQSRGDSAKDALAGEIKRSPSDARARALERFAEQWIPLLEKKAQAARDRRIVVFEELGSAMVRVALEFAEYMSEETFKKVVLCTRHDEDSLRTIFDRAPYGRFLLNSVDRADIALLIRALGAGGPRQSPRILLATMYYQRLLLCEEVSQPDKSREYAVLVGELATRIGANPSIHGVRAEPANSIVIRLDRALGGPRGG